MLFRVVNKRVLSRSQKHWFPKSRFYTELKPEDVKNQPSLNQFQSDFKQDSISSNKIDETTTNTTTTTTTTKPPVFFQSEKLPETFKQQGNIPPNSSKNDNEYPKQSKFRTYTFLGLAIFSLSYIVADIISILTPANMDFISKETLDLIAKAIESESNKNIDEAINYYLEALKQLDEENEEHISPCYTSCCVRIAELYESEKKFDKALLIYKELSDTYLNAFTHRFDFKCLRKDESFDFAISRSLTIAIRYAYLLPAKDVNIAREVLMFNIVESQKRIVEAYPPFLSILNDINNRNILDLITSDLEKTISHLSTDEQEKIIKEQSKIPVELPLFTTEQTPENKLLGLHVKAWPVFTRVLINAKDMYSNLSIEANDISAAISNLTSNSVIIQRCFDHPSRLSLTLAKLGVELQLTYQTINRDFPKGKEIEIIQDNEPVTVNLSSPELKNFVLNTTVSESKRIFLKVLSLCDTMKKQERIIKANHLGQNIAEWEAMYKPALDKSEMVSAASLGMISYHDGQLNQALRYFKRAKVLANKLKDEDYIDDMNEWIDLIEK
jgi:tetratricopeptide (TPR) repeat protein